MTRKKPRGSRKVQRRPAPRKYVTKASNEITLKDIERAMKDVEVDSIMPIFLDPKILEATRKNISLMASLWQNPPVVIPETRQERFKKEFRRRWWLFRCWWRRYVGFRFDKHEKDYDDEEW